MRKILASVFILLLLFIILLGAVNWYFSLKNEQLLSSLIKESSAVEGIDIVLENPEKTFFGATSKVKLEFTHSLLNDELGVLFLELSLRNGPIFFDKSGINFGFSRWTLSLDESLLSDEQQAWLGEFFLDEQAELLILIDFDHKSHYSLHSQTRVGKASLNGIYDSATAINDGVFSLENATLKRVKHHFHTDQIEARFRQYFNPNNNTELKGHHLSDKESKHEVSFHTPLLQMTNLQSNNVETLSIKSNQEIRIEKNQLNISWNTVFDVKNLYQLPLQEVNFSTNIQELSMDRIFLFLEQYASLDNLEKQVDWILEEQGELPEGQDHIWQLQDTKNTLEKNLPRLLNQALFENNAAIDFHITGKSNEGESKLSGQISTNQSPAVSAHITDYFQIHAEVDLASDLYQYISSTTTINRRQFTLSYKDNKLLMQ